MDFATGVKRAYETNWSYVNTFTVQLEFSDSIAKNINWSTEDTRDLSLNIISIDTPQLSNSPIESYVADSWKVHNGRDELYRFGITFRDQDQLRLYRKFVKAYFLQKYDYFDMVKSTIKLSKDSDYLGEPNAVTIFDFKDVLIESVSQIQFSNTTESQIAEFTVQFKSSRPEIE